MSRIELAFADRDYNIWKRDISILFNVDDKIYFPGFFLVVKSRSYFVGEDRWSLICENVSWRKELLDQSGFKIDAAVGHSN